MESLHEYVLKNLERSKADWEAVANGSGVSVRTIEKIASREIEFPRIDKVERLANYFREQRKRPKPN
jgi:transcriptional regulator with XRE-family HTH domain